MAFSTAQEQYIKSITAAFLKDHPEAQYIAYNDQDGNGADLHIIFADSLTFSSDRLDELDAGAYFVAIEGTSYTYDIITGNPSSYQGSYDNRITCEQSDTALSLAISGYNTVATNLTWENGYPLAGDIIQSEGVYYYEVQSDIQTQSLGIIGVLILLVLFFSWVFGKRS